MGEMQDSSGQALLQSIVDALPIRVFWKDRQGLYLGCNLMFARDAGFSRPDELIGKSDFDMGWSEQAEMYRADDFAVMESAQAKLAFDEPQTTPDGSRIWLRTSKVPLVGSDGVVYGILGTYEDITSLKQAEEALRESEEKHRALFETMAQGVVCHDSNGRIISANSSAERILGLSMDQMLGRESMDPRWHAIREDGSDYPGEIHPAMLALRTGKGIHNQVMGVFNLHDNAYRWININAVPQFRSGEQSPYMVYATFEEITERLKSDQRLAESEERMRLAMSVSRQAWFDLDILSGKADVSPEFPVILGFKAEEFNPSKEGWLDSIHPDDKPSVTAAFEHCLKTDEPVSAEYRRLGANGQWLWLHAIAKLMERDPQGRPLRLVGIFTDITERKAVEEEMAASRKRFETLFDASANGYYVLDMEGRFVDVNRTACERLGYSKQELMAKRVSELDTPECSGRVPERMAKIRKYGTATFESAHVCKDGSVMPVEINAKMVELDGKPVFFSLVRDITARIHAEQALRESEERLQIAQSIGHLGVWDWTPQTGELFWTPETYHVFGYREGEVEPSFELFLSHVHEDDRAMVQASVEAAIAEKVKYDIDCRFRRVDGSEAVANAQGKVFYDADGAPLRMLGTFQDITQRKATEDRLREALSVQQATLESTADGILVVGEDGCWSAYNQKFIDMWRITPDILQSGDDKRALDYVLDQLVDPQAFIDKVMGLYATPDAVSFDVLTFKDGRVFERYSTPQYIEDEVRGRVWSFRDVTDRHYAEEQLRISEERFALAMEGANDGLWDWNLETDEVYYSPRWFGMLGYEPNEFPPTLETGRQLMHPEDRDRVFFAVADYLEGRRDSYEVEIRMLHKDGHYVTVLARASKVVREADGRPVRLVGTHVDISERKRTEQELLQTRFVMDTAPYNITFLDAQANIHYLNKTARETFGLSEEDVQRGLKLHDIDPALTAEIWDAHWKDLKENRRVILERMHRRKDGTSFPVEIIANYVEFGDEAFNAAFDIDITDRKAAEEEMAASRQRFETLFDASADGYFVLGLDGHFVDVNRTACERLGYSKQELMAKPVPVLDSPEFAGKVAERMAMIQKQGVATFESAHVCRDGTVMPVEINARMVELDGKPVIFSLVRDITERKHQRELLEAGRKRFLTLFDSSADALMIHDMNGRILEVNRTACERLGYSHDELLSMHVTDIVSEEFAGTVGERVERTGQQGSSLFESQHRSKDGMIIPVEISAKLIDLDGKPVVFSVARDISERKMFEEQLRQSQKMEAIGTLVGGIAHDFNNMLAAIQGNVFLARMHAQDNPLAGDKLDDIEQLGNRAAEMVQQLLTFARKDSVEMRVVSLKTFIKEGLKLAAAAIPENIEHQVEVCDDELNVRGDITQLQQVLMNLLNNAVDAVHGVASPRISSSLDVYVVDHAFRLRHPQLLAGRFARLSVRDNGIGIAPESLDKIFEPFFTTKDVGKGTGLGLAMIYGAVQSHGGVIEVESKPGEGTSFHVILPLCDAGEEQDGGGKAASSSRGGGELILLVDDEEKLRSTTSEVLTTMGYRVLEADDGERALALFRNRRDDIDLILSDIIMPNMGGKELLEAVREENVRVPVILVTGYDKEHVLDASHRWEHCEVMSKPFDFLALSRTIRSLIDKSH